MAKRLDWEKAKRQERRRAKGKTRKSKRSDHDRQQAMHLFVFRHQLACFKCGESIKIVEWAKTGFSKRGPWAVCSSCVTEKR